jgi:hypothetical protein
MRHQVGVNFIVRGNLLDRALPLDRLQSNLRFPICAVLPSVSFHLPPRRGSEFYTLATCLNFGEHFKACAESYSPGGGGQACMGNEVFDAIGGLPGTFLSLDQYGNLSFGWSYSLYSATMNEIDSLNYGLSNGPPLRGTNLPPDVKGQVAYTEYVVFIYDLPTMTVVSGVIPDLISATYNLAQDSYSLKQAVLSGNAGSFQMWKIYVEYDLAIYNQALDNLINLIFPTSPIPAGPG